MQIRRDVPGRLTAYMCTRPNVLESGGRILNRCIVSTCCKFTVFEMVINERLLISVAEPLGDYNHNGNVDAADYRLLRSRTAQLTFINSSTHELRR